MKHLILFVLVWTVWWPGIVCFKGICFTSLFHYGNKSLILFMSQDPCQKSAVLVFLCRTVLLGCEHKSSREALSIKANSVSALSNTFVFCVALSHCVVWLSYNLCASGLWNVVLVQLLSGGHVPHTLFQKFAELKCMHWSVWPSAQKQLQNFVQQSQ